MSDVVLLMTASIDGFVDAPDGHAGGLAEPNELQRRQPDRVRRAGRHNMGRVNYLQMAPVWPTATGDYATPESTIAGGNLADEGRSAPDQSGGEITAWGGAASYRPSPGSEQLINQYVVITRPVAYGGAPIFHDFPDALHLELVYSTTSRRGTMLGAFEPPGRRHEADREHR